MWGGGGGEGGSSGSRANLRFVSGCYGAMFGEAPICKDTWLVLETIEVGKMLCYRGLGFRVLKFKLEDPTFPERLA